MDFGTKVRMSPGGPVGMSPENNHSPIWPLLQKEHRVQGGLVFFLDISQCFYYSPESETVFDLLGLWAGLSISLLKSPHSPDAVFFITARPEAAIRIHVLALIYDLRSKTVSYRTQHPWDPEPTMTTVYITGPVPFPADSKRHSILRALVSASSLWLSGPNCQTLA